MCLPTNWITVNRLRIFSEDRTDTISLSTTSSESDTFLEPFQDTLSLSESDQTQVDQRPDLNRTIWNIQLLNIQIRDNNGDLERFPRDAQGPRRV